MSMQLPYWFVHHSAGDSCYDQENCMGLVRGIQNFHMDTRGWNDIGYSFLIGGDGNVYEGRGWNVEGAHTKSFNDQGYGIDFIGTFISALPDEAAIETYHRLSTVIK